MSDREVFVIVGASLAGARAAATLRAEGFDGRIVLIGEEDVRPYERPPLSKTLLRGESDFDAAAVHEAGFYDMNAIELVLSTRGSAVDPTDRTVTIEGTPLRFDKLLLTTGSEVRRLRVPGADLDGVFYLRSYADSMALQDAIKKSSRVVVIGAGWIGSEVAASARQMGAEVALIEAAGVPLERVLGSDVGALFAELHAAHGVELHMGVGVESIVGRRVFEAVRLADGTEVGGDIVVVGIGVTPRTQLAEQAGLDVDNGVLVDELLVSSNDAVLAAGDVANAFHPLFGTRIRLEHWSAALNQGPVAAKNMLGQRVAYTKVPYFFSDQYDLGMEYNGYATSWDEIVYRGDRDRREVIVFWCKESRVLAGMNVNVWEVSGTIADIVASKKPVDLLRLADQDVDLASLI